MHGNQLIKKPCFLLDLLWRFIKQKVKHQKLIPLNSGPYFHLNYEFDSHKFIMRESNQLILNWKQQC